MAIDLKKKSSAQVANAIDSDHVVLYIDTNGDVFTKDDLGNETPLIGVSLAMLNAAITNFEDSAALNVRDIANRARAAHTGTQLAGTISDFENEVSTILDRTIQEDIITSVSTSNSFDTRFTTTIVPQHTGLYKVSVNYIWFYDTTTSNFEANLLIDGSLVRHVDTESKDAGGNAGGIATDVRHCTVLEALVSAVQGTPFDVSLQYRGEANGVTNGIDQHVLTVERVI